MIIQSKYSQLEKSTDLKNTFIDYFQFLSDTPGSDYLLNKIADKVEQFDDLGFLRVHFNTGISLDCLAPAEKDYSSWPQTYQQIMLRHEARIKYEVAV